MNQTIGKYHAGEPEGFDFDSDEWLGTLWEHSDDDEAREDFADMLTQARLDAQFSRLAPAATRIEAAWTAAGRPSPIVDATHLQALLRAALRASYDVYDSDTRSYIFAEPLNCAEPGDAEAETECNETCVSFGITFAVLGTLNVTERQDDLLNLVRVASEAVANGRSIISIETALRRVTGD